MITKRTTEDTLVVSIYDEAIIRLMDSKPQRVRKYIATRNLSDIGVGKDGRIEESADVATIFKVKPLPQKMVQLIDGARDSSIHHRMIFKACVSDVKNAGDIIIERDDEDKTLSDDTIDSLGTDIVKDIALYCIEQREGKNGSTVPFSSRDGWQTHASRLLAFVAASASTETKSASEE